MIIGIDLDEVLAATADGLLKFSNPKYELSLTKDKIFSHSLGEVWGCSLEEETKRWHEFYEDISFDEIIPLPGAVEGIEELNKRNKLIVITGRENRLIEKTNEWIEKFFPNKFSQICFAEHFVIAEGRKTKAEICDELGVDILIEDIIDYAASCANDSRKVLLFDRPWNQINDLPKNVHRVYSWKEIVDFINGLSD
jgi:uncharacterized HAD superfamily protein